MRDDDDRAVTEDARTGKGDAPIGKGDAPSGREEEGWQTIGDVRLIERSVRSEEMTALELLYRELTRALSENVGLTVTQYRILLKLQELSNKARIKDIASGLGMRSNLVSMAVNALEKRKLIRRVRGKSDGRATNVVLTNFGISTLGLATDSVGAHLASLWKDLPRDEAEKAQSTMIAIGENLTGGHQEETGTFIGSEYVTTIVDVHDRFCDIAKGAANLTYTGWRVLKMVHDLDGRARMGDLANRLFLLPSTLTWIGGQLEDLGFVTRESDTETANGIYLAITATGSKAVETVQKAVDGALMPMLWGDLPDEQYMASRNGSDLIVREFAVRREIADGGGA